MKLHLFFWSLVIALVCLTIAAIQFDAETLRAFTAVQNPFLTIFMVGITHIATLYIGVLVIFLLFIGMQDKKTVWNLAAALIIDVLLVIFLKIIVARPRPYQVLDISSIFSEKLGSFPSGHASRAFAMFGVIGHFYKKYKIPLYCLAALIAISRIYLGVHYPTDVLVGALLGMLVSQATIQFKLGERLHRTILKLRSPLPFHQ